MTLNVFEHFKSETQALSTLKLSAFGFASLAITHVYAAVGWLAAPADLEGLVASYKWVFILVQLAASVTCGVLFLIIWRTRASWPAWVLLAWSVVAIAWPITFALYGFASDWFPLVIAIYGALLAIRSSRAARRFHVTAA
jgi:hypothetical protein